MNRFARCGIVGGCVVLAALMLWRGCTTTQPAQVLGPSVVGNEPPTLEILAPSASFSINRGERFDIRWADRDPDSAAKVSFTLQDIDVGFEILLISNIEENDSLAADEFSVATSLVPFGSYYIRGEINDGFNPPVSTFAITEGSASTRVEVTIGEPGTNPLNVPPQIAVRQPSFNQGVAQDDTLVVEVFPTATGDTTVPALVPYDADSDTRLFILLDLDDDPENDDPLIPDASQIIILRDVDLAEGDNQRQVFTIPIDLGSIPPRTNGLPYFIRATIIDESNPPVHAYAAGTIHIVRSATGTVDLSEVGTTLAGARFQGFNPGSLLGSRMISTGDFDADGVNDFLLVARRGNPRNFGNIGEAYLIYGQDQIRFGGASNVNSVSSTIPGVIFEAPPNRLDHLHGLPEHDPRGITDVATVDDLTGDGRPELLFGCALVDGGYQGRDDDPGDDPDVVRVEYTARNEFQSLTLNDVTDETLDDDFRGVFDTYIDRNDDSDFGDSPTLLFSSTVQDQVDQFVIIGFDLPAVLTLADPADISDLQATLTFFLDTLTAITEDSGAVHRLLGFADDTLTFSDFNLDGTPGPTEDTEYDADDLSFTVNFFGSPRIDVDVTATIQGILDGEIGTLSPAWIFVLSEQVSGSFHSSEAADEELRPQLTITANRAEPADLSSNISCYPDNLPNNKSDRVPPAPTNPPHDSTFESGGVVFFVASENRDNQERGGINPDRLEQTSVALELVGQTRPPVGLNPVDGLVDAPSPEVPQPQGDVDTLAGPLDAPTRTRGCRMLSGWYDYINDSSARGNRGRAAPRAGFFGEHVASMPDTDGDGDPEIIISAPRNELYLQSITGNDGECVVDFPTRGDFHNCTATGTRGSIRIYPSADYSTIAVALNAGGAQSLPSHNAGFTLGTCSGDRTARGGTDSVRGGFEIFAEDPTDFLGGAEHAGDVNKDGVPDIVCGAPLNDHPSGLVDTGAAYIVYGRVPIGTVQLQNLDDPGLRPPTLRIRGETAGDMIGTVQTKGTDVNGDGTDDIFIGSPTADCDPDDNPDCPLSATVESCGDMDGNGIVDANDLDIGVFTACRNVFGDEVFLEDGDKTGCKAYDFDNDRDIDDDDRNVFDCLVAGFSNCCPVDNGFVAVIYGDVNLDGDRDISQIGTRDVPGIKLFGASAGDRAGADVQSAGDFNRDGFGDLLIAAPGVIIPDDGNGRQRMGVAYLIFGGTHLNNSPTFSLDQVGTAELPGIVFWSPFVTGAPNEAPIDHVGLLGDINNDGFDDIALGITRADFIDSALPQDPNDPGTDPNIGRRPDDGNVYVIYGNNTGANQ